MSEPRLMRRDFALLWQGLLVSQLGDQAFLVAQMLWITQRTDSRALLGTLLAATTLRRRCSRPSPAPSPTATTARR